MHASRLRGRVMESHLDMWVEHDGSWSQEFRGIPEWQLSVSRKCYGGLQWESLEVNRTGPLGRLMA